MGADVSVRFFNDNGDVRTLVEIRADIVRLAIATHNGNISSAARALGLGRSTAYNILRTDPTSASRVRIGRVNMRR
jgi:transcriptional regulator of acetoin/glycerol metabolism